MLAHYQSLVQFPFTTKTKTRDGPTQRCLVHALVYTPAMRTLVPWYQELRITAPTASERHGDLLGWICKTLSRDLVPTSFSMKPLAIPAASQTPDIFYRRLIRPEAQSRRRVRQVGVSPTA